MAIPKDTFAAAGGAVSDIFAGIGARTSSRLRAKGLNIEAMGTELSAQSLRIKAGGDLAEGQEYGLAGELARQNAEYTRTSTAMQQSQLDRSITQTIGSQQAATAVNGLRQSGSALYLLADSAQQGALAKHALELQGHITEAGYEEQAKSYDLMRSTAEKTAAGEYGIADQTVGIAGMQRQLALDTEEAGKEAEIGSFVSAALKGVSAIAGIALPGTSS